jgi:phospholipase A-2-activating protein
MPTSGCGVLARCSTVRVWGNDGSVEVLEGHGGAVLAVLVLPSGDILSGSGDKTVKLWSHGKCVRTFAGHGDSVRQAIPGHPQTVRV